MKTKILRLFRSTYYSPTESFYLFEDYSEPLYILWDVTGGFYWRDILEFLEKAEVGHWMSGINGCVIFKEDEKTLGMEIIAGINEEKYNYEMDIGQFKIFLCECVKLWHHIKPDEIVLKRTGKKISLEAIWHEKETEEQIKERISKTTVNLRLIKSNGYRSFDSIDRSDPLYLLWTIFHSLSSKAIIKFLKQASVGNKISKAKAYWISKINEQTLQDCSII